MASSQHAAERTGGQPLESFHSPAKLLWTSFRALLPTLIFDVGGAMVVYYLLYPHFPKTSILPLLGASLVPVISNVVNFVRRRSLDVIGIIVIIGLLAGVAGALFGGSQRLLLLRESFVTGLLGVILIVSVVRHKPLAYYAVHEFLTANEALPAERFNAIWQSQYFRRGIRIMTILWGAVLIGDFLLRAFMALTMNIAFVLGVAPIISTVLLLIVGAINAWWLGHAIRIALEDHQRIMAAQAGS